MKVGVIGPRTPDSFSDNLLSALSQMGHEAFPLGPISPRVRGKFAQATLQIIQKPTPIEMSIQERLVRRSQRLNLDLVLTTEGGLLPRIVERIRARGTVTVLWFPDHVMNLGRMLMFVAPYDAIFFKEPWVVRQAQRLLSTRVFYLPEACNPLWHKPHKRTNTTGKVVVAGNMHPFRVQLLEMLLAKGIPLELYGPPFPRWLDSPLKTVHTGRYIARHEKAHVFRSASVVLNNLHPGEIEGVNCRLFEAAGSGATVVTEDRAELRNLFLPGKEVIAFSTASELIEAIESLLDDQRARIALGDAAATRAHHEHTYQHRLTKLLDLVGLG